MPARFRGHDAGETTDFFCELLAQETSLKLACIIHMEVCVTFPLLRMVNGG